MWCIASFKRQSKVFSASWETEGAQRKRCKNLGALKDDPSRINASCELILRNLCAAVARSSQHLFHAVSRAGPWNNGAPRREASSMSTRVKDRSRLSEMCCYLCIINSHFEVFRWRPIVLPTSTIDMWPRMRPGLTTSTRKRNNRACSGNTPHHLQWSSYTGSSRPARPWCPYFGTVKVFCWLTT